MVKALQGICGFQEFLYVEGYGDVGWLKLGFTRIWFELCGLSTVPEERDIGSFLSARVPFRILFIRVPRSYV